MWDWMHFYNINTEVMSNANIYINLVEVVFCRQKFATGRHSIHKNNAQCSMLNEDSTQVIFADVNGVFCFLVWVYLVCFYKNLPFEWTVFTIQQFKWHIPR